MSDTLSRRDGIKVISMFEFEREQLLRAFLHNLPLELIEEGISECVPDSDAHKFGLMLLEAKRYSLDKPEKVYQWLAGQPDAELRIESLTDLAKTALTTMLDNAVGMWVSCETKH